MDRLVRIGGASGAWGDSPIAIPQLLAAGVDYLVFDYLAELTMSLLARARERDPGAGYATDFVDQMSANLPAIAERGVRVISNAGGVNPEGCAEALRARAAELGLGLRIALVTGDDAMAQVAARVEAPSGLRSANAYLGALPIARALDAGADIVVTGRCVDSAVTLGALIHEFGWAEDDWDRLAAGSLAGHIVECGPQATGGLFTDWEDIPDWAHIGYPIIEAEASGIFAITKPAGTGGRVIPAVIAEQILYEVGDPGAYVLPDVICDLRNVSLRQTGPERVAVEGVCGRAPTADYKVSITYQDGFRAHMSLTVIGFDADRKAQRLGEAILIRAREAIRAAGYGDFARTKIEILGAESVYGPHRHVEAPREVVLRLSVSHRDRAALAHFAAEAGATGLSYAPGVTGLGARPKPIPNLKLDALLLPKTEFEPRIDLDGRPVELPVACALPEMDGKPAPAPEANAAVLETRSPEVGWERHPLIVLAHGRSGDKGNNANIAILARSPEALPVLRSQLTAEAVADYLAHLVEGPVTRFEAPGLLGFNFLCERALEGGVAGSLRNDPWGKGFAQILLSMPIAVPPDLLAEGAGTNESMVP